MEPTKIELTDEQKKDVQERGQAFLTDLNELIKKHQITLMPVINFNDIKYAPKPEAKEEPKADADAE